MRVCVLLGEQLKFCVDVHNVFIFISNQESLWRGKKNVNRRAVNSPGFNYVGAVVLTAANL